MDMMVRAGIPPIEVIGMATRISAENIGMGSQLGTIAPGKLADIIVVNGNPLRSMREAMRRVIEELPSHGDGRHQRLLVGIPRRVEPSVGFPRSVLALPLRKAVSHLKLGADLGKQFGSPGAVVDRRTCRAAAGRRPRSC